MKKNIGAFDRMVRLVLAGIFIGIYLTGIANGFWGILLISVSSILLLTNLFNFCPIYYGLGWNTFQRRQMRKN